MSRAPFVMPKATAAFGRNAEIYDTTIGWRFVNPKLRDAVRRSTRCRARRRMSPTTSTSAARTRTGSRKPARNAPPRRRPRAASPPRSSRSSIPQRKGDPVKVDQDEHPRLTSLDALAKLRPIVRKDGTVTAGNASGVNDGAAALIVASEEAAKRHGLTPRARILGAAVAGVAAADHGHRPRPRQPEIARAARPDHRRHGRDRTQRSLRRAGPRGPAPARASRRCRRT